MERYIHDFGVRGGLVLIVSSRESFDIRTLGPSGEFLTDHVAKTVPKAAYTQLNAINKVMKSMGISIIMKLHGTVLDVSELIRGLKFTIMTEERDSVYFGDMPIVFGSRVISPSKDVIIPMVIRGEKRAAICANMMSARDREEMSEEWKPVKVIFG